MSDRTEDDIACANDDLRLLYQVTVSDLAFFKGQQWSVTNYALLIFAALVGVTQLDQVEDLLLSDRTLLLALATVDMVLAFVALIHLHCSIKLRRARLTSVRGKLSKSFKESWSVLPKERDGIDLFLGIVLVVSWGFVTWLIGCRLQ
jgi:hypothetical protein